MSALVPTAGETISQSMITGLSNAFDPNLASAAESNREISKEAVKAVRIKVADMAIDTVQKAEAVLGNEKTSGEGREAIVRILKGIAPEKP